MMDKEIKITILAGLFAILTVFIAYLLPILIPPSTDPNIELSQFSVSVCPKLESNYTYTCLNFEIKNTGNEIAIINLVEIKVLNSTVIPNSSQTSSYPRIADKELPTDMYLIRLRSDLEPPYSMGVGVYYPLPPHTGEQFHILLDSDKTAAYDIMAIVHYDHKVEKTPHIKLILENINSSLSTAYQTKVEKVVKGNKYVI